MIRIILRRTLNWLRSSARGMKRSLRRHICAKQRKVPMRVFALLRTSAFEFPHQTKPVGIWESPTIFGIASSESVRKSIC